MPTTKRQSSRPASVPRLFSTLNAALPLRPIHDRIDLEHAMEMVDRLALLLMRTADQDDYLQTLSTLIEKYEAEHDPIDASGVTPLHSL